MKYALVKTIVLVVLFQFSYSVFSSPTDSLYRVVYESDNFDLIRDVLPVYEKNATDESLGKFYFLIAWKYEKIQNMGKSFDYYKQSLKLYEKVGDLVGQKKCFDNLGRLALKLHQHSKAYKYYYRAYEISKERKNDKEIARSLFDIGITLSSKPDSRTESIWYLTQSEDIYKQIDEYESLSKVCFEKGVVFQILGSNKDAVEWYNRALDYNPNSKKLKAKILNNHAEILFLKGDHNTAMAKLDLAIELKRKLGDGPLLISSLNTLGIFEYELGHYEKAYAALLESFNINISQKELKQFSHEHLQESFVYMDSVCLALGDESKLLENGVYRSILAKEGRMIENLESYRVKDLAFQGELIEEKEELAEQKAFLHKMLICGGVLICVILVLLVYLLRDNMKHRLHKRVSRQNMKSILKKHNLMSD